MEALAFYLLKSVIWLAGFAFVFLLFLRNERFFLLNRIFLIAGILTSFLFPLVSIHYTVVLPVIKSLQTGSAVVSAVHSTGISFLSELKLILLVFYCLGAFFVLMMVIRQAISVLRTVRKSSVINIHPVKLIKTTDYTSAFSFFSYVFVNPSITDAESREIMNHELVHVRQKHWLDLVLVEMLCVMQWFNPVVWIYIRFMRQNHEYLADEVALQRTSDPAIYKAALLNQIVGAPVVSLANSFNYSLNSKRFKMMKNIISSPYRKMKILLILPVFAVVLFAFAKPDYKYKLPDDNSGNKNTMASQVQHEVKGVIVQQDGQPLPGAIITLRATTIGTIADSKGSFLIGNVPDDGQLVVSFVGFKSKVLKPVFTAPMKIEMVRDTVIYEQGNITAPPPPPPPPPISEMFNEDGPQPLFIVDGVKMTKAEIKKIDPNTIESIVILKDKSPTQKMATEKYGDEGKNGVVLLTSKKASKGSSNPLPEVAPPPPPPPPPADVDMVNNDDKKPFVEVETLPEFPGGGKDAMVVWISNNLKYPAEAVKNKIEGKVIVNFLVSASGKVKDVIVVKSTSPTLSTEAVRVVSSMPDWKPATQGGKGVDVQVRVPVEFKLN